MMNDRLRTRPKSSASTMARSGALNYTVVRGTDSWRKEPNGVPVWATDTSTLGIKGSKVIPQSWQMNMAANSGAFLPVLNAKAQAISAQKIPKRYKSAILRHQESGADKGTTSKTGGKIISTNTASLLDLTAMVPPAYTKRGTVNLYRENSLPVNFRVQSHPALRYSHDSGVTSVLSKLDLFDKQDQTTPDNQQDKQTIIIPNPPAVRRPEETEKGDSISTSTVEKGDNPLGESTESKWKLNVTLPEHGDSVLSDKSPDTKGSTESAAVADEIDTIIAFNNPQAKTNLKPIDSELLNVKPEMENGPPVVPAPPSIKRENSIAVSKKRINRKKSAETKVKVGYVDVAESLTDIISDSDNASIEPETDSTVDSSSKVSDQIKVVRFAEQPANIKEYYPWEPPQNSIVYQEVKVVVKKPQTKVVPVFRP